MVERKKEYYIEEPLDEFDRVVLNFILSTQHVRNSSCCRLDAVEEISDTIAEKAANGELD